MHLILAMLLSSAGFWLAGIPAVQAQNVRVERIQIVGTGIIEVGKSKTIKDKTIITGQRTEATKSTIVKQTTDIPAVVDTVFGVDFRMVGVPRGKKATLRIIWRYPEPGIKNPNGTVTTVDAYDDVFTSGPDTNTVYWSLAAAWTLVPGKWSLELWQDKRRLMNVDFNLVK